MKTLVLSIVLLFSLGKEPTPLLIMKTAHSGSSWFTSLLNRLEGVYITEEIDGESYRTEGKKQIERLSEGVTAYICDSLQHPMLVWPDGEDWTQQKRSFYIVGSTFNPLRSFANLDEIARLVPSLRVVAYFRTNIVKHVVSTFRARELYRKCNNWVTLENCKLESKTTLVLEDFEERLILTIAQDVYIWQAANSITANLKHKFRVVVYEELIGLKNEVENLLWWLGINITELEYTDEYKGRCNLNCTKNTSDDLQDSIANYEEVESWIDSRYPCLSSQFLETRPGKVQPFVHYVCGDLFRSRVDSYIKKTLHKI